MTFLVQITHAVSGTDDVTYGCAADQALSDARKIVNADNYNVCDLKFTSLTGQLLMSDIQCFTTQVYANTRC